jgi:NADH:ubiquinone oxidoreductase subunit F (NADH-binding)
MGYPFKKFLEEDCGGVPNGKKLKGVIPGGASMPVLKPDEIEKVNLDYESVAAAGSFLGSGGVIVMDETTCMVRAAWSIARFFAHESCGCAAPAAKAATGWKRFFSGSSMASGEERSGFNSQHRRQYHGQHDLSVWRRRGDAAAAFIRSTAMSSKRISRKRDAREGIGME